MKFTHMETTERNENVQVALFFGTILAAFAVFGIYLFSNYTPSFGW